MKEENDARSPREIFVEAMREMAEWLRGDERMIDRLHEIARAFADAECGGLERYDSAQQWDHDHAACRAAIVKEIFGD